jgi:uridylate kinase
VPKLNLNKRDPLIISVGGSLLIPDDNGPDIEYLKSLRKLVLKFLKTHQYLVIIAGGGRTSRRYIQAADAVHKLTNDDLDWLGIHSTRLNGHLVKTILSDVAHPVVYKNPLRVPPVRKWRGRVLISAGWKPGWSTDYVACRIARRLAAKAIVNLSNIDFVYSSDPKKNADAEAYAELRWHDYRKLVGDQWSPGLSAPFDPVAAKYCHKHGMSVAVVNGRQIEQVSRALQGENFKGTVLT